MYIDNITQEEAQCIDDIWSGGWEEIKDLTMMESVRLNTNNINTSQWNVGDLNKKLKENSITTLKSKRPKSNALQNLIKQLKQKNEYCMSSDDENWNIKNRWIENNNNSEHVLTIGNSNSSNKVYNQNESNKIETPGDNADKKLDIKRLEINTIKFNSLKSDMESIQNKIVNWNSKLSRTVKSGNNVHTGKIKYSDTSRNNIMIESASTFNKIKSRLSTTSKGKIRLSDNSNRKAFGAKGIQRSSSYSLNNSFNNSYNSTSLITPAYHRGTNNINTYSYKWKYDEIKSKYIEQQNRIREEKESIRKMEQEIIKIKNKNANYPKLVDYNKQWLSQEEWLRHQLNDSENIRKDQSKLIRSLQKEINVLRGETNWDEVAEYYQQMKESLLKSNISWGNGKYNK